jgi:hypothetical protein
MIWIQLPRLTPAGGLGLKWTVVEPPKFLHSGFKSLRQGANKTPASKETC